MESERRIHGDAGPGRRSWGSRRSGRTGPRTDWASPMSADRWLAAPADCAGCPHPPLRLARRSGFGPLFRAARKECLCGPAPRRRTLAPSYIVLFYYIVVMAARSRAGSGHRPHRAPPGERQQDRRQKQSHSSLQQQQQPNWSWRRTHRARRTCRRCSTGYRRHAPVPDSGATRRASRGPAPGHSCRRRRRP